MSVDLFMCLCSTNTLLFTPIFITYVDNFKHTLGREAIQATHIHRYELCYNKYLATCYFKHYGNGFVYQCRITLQKKDCVF